MESKARKSREMMQPGMTTLLVKFIQCILCGYTYKNPRNLSCGHSFCLSCVEKLAENQNNIRCPLCRRITILLLVTFKDLPRNHSLISLINSVQRDRDDEFDSISRSVTFPRNVLICRLCQSVRRDLRNLKCGHSFCLSCIETNAGNTFICILCNQESETRIPSKGWNQLSKNYPLISIIDENLETMNVNQDTSSEDFPTAEDGENFFRILLNSQEIICDNIEEFNQVREKSIQTSGEICVALRNAKKGTNIGTIVGSLTGIAGGILGITGVALAGPTFGVPLRPGIAGAVIGTLGGATATSSTIANSIITRSRGNDIMELVKHDQKITEIITPAVEEFINYANELLQNQSLILPPKLTEDLIHVVPCLSSLSTKIGSAAAVIVDGIAIARTGAQIGGKVAATSARVASGVLSGIFVLVDVVVLGMTVHDMIRGSSSELIDNITKIKKELEDEHTLVNHIADLRLIETPLESLIACQRDISQFYIDWHQSRINVVNNLKSISYQLERKKRFIKATQKFGLTVAVVAGIVALTAVLLFLLSSNNMLLWIQIAGVVAGVLAGFSAVAGTILNMTLLRKRYCEIIEIIQHEKNRSKEMSALLANFKEKASAIANENSVDIHVAVRRTLQDVISDPGWSLLELPQLNRNADFEERIRKSIEAMKLELDIIKKIVSLQLASNV